MCIVSFRENNLTQVVQDLAATLNSLTQWQAENFDVSSTSMLVCVCVWRCMYMYTEL